MQKRAKVVVFLIKQLFVFFTFSSPSASLDLKVPIANRRNHVKKRNNAIFLLLLEIEWEKSWRENDLISRWNLPWLRYCGMLLEKCIMGYYSIAVCSLIESFKNKQQKMKINFSLEGSRSGARLRPLNLFERILRSQVYDFVHDRAWINSKQWKYCSSSSRLDYQPLFFLYSGNECPLSWISPRRNKGAPFERFEMSFKGGAGTK